MNSQLIKIREITGCPDDADLVAHVTSLMGEIEQLKQINTMCGVMAESLFTEEMASDIVKGISIRGGQEVAVTGLDVPVLGVGYAATGRTVRAGFNEYESSVTDRVVRVGFNEAKGDNTSQPENAE
ncbi:hypothetical protein ACP97I_16600 [Raoultella ornithinolytica]|uniref:hypothetical protein n=1 Tax=Raoultella ornithinolytica TaxID=54291 RepID=UPI003D96B869